MISFDVHSPHLPPFIDNVWYSDQTWPLFNDTTHPQNFAPHFIINVSLTRLGLSSPTWHIHKTLPLPSLSMFLWPDLASLHQHIHKTLPLPSLSMFDTLSKLGLSSPTLHIDKTLPLPSSLHYQCLTLCPNLASLHQHCTLTKLCPDQTWPLFTNTTHRQNLTLPSSIH